MGGSRRCLVVSSGGDLRAAIPPEFTEDHIGPSCPSCLDSVVSPEKGLLAFRNSVALFPTHKFPSVIPPEPPSLLHSPISASPF